MSEVDILLVTACMAALTSLFNLYSVIQVKKQVDLQYKQWEYSNKPVFRFIYMANLDKDKYLFIIENSNDKFHQFTKIYFTNENVKINDSFYGSLENRSKIGSEIKTKNEHKGLAISLTLKDHREYKGQIVLEGTDLLGNDFKAYSLPLHFIDYSLKNHLKVTKTYLLNCEE